MTHRPRPHRRSGPLPTPLRATAMAARAACGGLGVLMLGAAPWDVAVAQVLPKIVSNAALPIACAATGNCGARTFVQTGSVLTGQPVYGANGTQMTVTQSSNTALLNWSSFNVGAGNTVNFAHVDPKQTFVTINKIYDTTLSTINGNISAPHGQIYLINPNGLLFGKTARVDVAGLIASTLNLSDKRATHGLLGDSTPNAAFAVDTSNPLAASAAVQVDQGAVIQAGNVYVFAPNVTNAGSIQVTPGGQVVLAAGQRVFLAGSTDVALRGLLVEVGQGGTVTNSGDILTPHGNTTMIGMAVNQAGRITATSALNENGSIRLVAREVVSDGSSNPTVLNSGPPDMFLNAAATGKVTVASGSTTQVLLDTSDTATAPLSDATAAATRSTVTVDGGEVAIGGNGAAGSTLIQAHGGDVAISARTDVSQINAVGVTAGVADSQATLNVGADVKIDVSGERNVQIDGNRNYIYIDRLTSNDLANAPLQRDGFLLGKGVYVNVAGNTPLMNLNSRRDALGATQAERNANGGTIALVAEGAVTADKGAQFDISGGTSVTSTATGRTSQLLTASGAVVDIMKASPNVQYVGFADTYTQTLNAPREGLNSSTTFNAPRITATPQFTEGKDAGTLEIVAPKGSFAGTIAAGTSPGPTQRGKLPQGGQVLVNSVLNSVKNIDQQVSFSRANVLLTNDLSTVGTTVPASEQDKLITLDTTMLQAGGVTRLSVLSDGYVTLARGASLDMGPVGTISLLGNAVDVNASLTAHGGIVTVGPRPVSDLVRARSLVSADDFGNVRFGSGVSLDASGTFTNDTSIATTGGTPAAPIVNNGGKITVTGRQVDVSDVTSFNVDAGANVAAGGAVSGGQAGWLTIGASNALDSVNDVGVLKLGGELASRIRGFGFSGGGNLSLAAPTLVVGNNTASVAPGAVQLGTSLFDRGFQNYTLTASDRLTVQGGTVIAPPVRQYQVNAALRGLADGAALSTAAVPQASLPGNPTPASSLTFAASGINGTVKFEAGSVVNAGVQGGVRATAGQSIDVEGRLAAAAGSVNLSLVGPLASNSSGAVTVERMEQQAIQLGAQSVLDVSGVSQVTTNALGQRTGAVLDGGTVSIAATQGNLAVASGAQILARGTRDQVDMPAAGASTRVGVASRGGAVSLTAQQGLFVDGTVAAQSGGKGIEGGRLTVNLIGFTQGDQTNPNYDANVESVLLAPDRVLTLGGSGSLPMAGGPFTALQYAGQGRVQASLINDSGFGTVQISSANTIAAAAGLPALSTASSITLDAQALNVAPGTTLSVSAPTVSLGFQPRSQIYAPNVNAAATGGTGQLKVNARQVNLAGSLALQGIGKTTIAATDDVNLLGGASAADQVRPQGQLQTAGDLTLSAAQVTPVSMTDYTISLVDNPQATLTIDSKNAAVPLEPLSAAGSVALNAPHIDISGRVTAPQGRININGSDSVTLDAGAVLSVASTLDVPLGTVFNGSQWVYATDPNLSTYNLATTGGGVTGLLPQKRIGVTGSTVRVDAKARINVSGGGDTVAQEFVAGPGGSIDVRQNVVPSSPGSTTLVHNTMFALMPTRGDHAAPYDPMIYTGLTQDAAAGGSALLRVGQTITLGAGSGIPAGTYTVMPVAYALLPGAYAVQPVSGYANLQPGQVVSEAAGTAIVAGKLGVGAGDASSSLWGGYRVYNGTQFRQLAELHDYSGSTFTTTPAAATGQVAPRTALDAGALSIAANQISLSTDSIQASAGSVLQNGTTVSGRGMEFSLSAPHLVITDQPATANATPSDTLMLNAQSLSKLKAETLVLGAAASHGEGSAADLSTLTLATGAQTVLVGGAQTLSAGEVLLVGSQQINVGIGSAIAADASQAPVTRSVALDGDGAGLLVSNAAALPVWSRSNTTGAAGDLFVATSATLSGRSVLFDASHTQQYAPSVVLNASNIGLSASQVNLGDVPLGTSGLNLSNALVAQFNGANSFSLTSNSSFDVYGDVTLGNASLKALVLDGAGFIAHPSGNSAVPTASATVVAGDVSLRNSSGATPADAMAGGTGTLSISAVGGNGASGSVSLTGGALAARGFASTRITATGQADASGTASKVGTGQLRFNGIGTLVTDGDVTLDAARIVASAGAVQSVTAGGVLRTQASSADSNDLPQALGATLTLSGQSVQHSGRIVLPSGTVRLQATGGGAGDDVNLLANSVINVAGSTQDFLRPGSSTPSATSADASAGSISLNSASGSVRALANSTLNIAGAGSNGDAGALNLSATQGGLQVDAAANWLATPGTAARGAEVSVDVGSLPDLGSIARPLVAATGGTQALAFDVRVRNGDVTLNAGDKVSAHSILIEADGGANAARANDGQVLINGTLDASGSEGGRIEVYARDRIALGSTALLDAHSSAAGQDGGSVLLSARIRANAPNAVDAISVTTGAHVNLVGGSGALGGTATFRAPAVNGNDVAIAALPTVTGAREVVVEATTVAAYQNDLTLNASAAASITNPLPALRTNLQTYANNLLANGAVMARLDPGHAANIQLRPGLEIQSKGNITVANAIDFTSGLSTDGSGGSFQWRYGGNTLSSSQPGALTLRAGGNLTLNGGLLDGFSDVTTSSAGVAINSNATLQPFANSDSWRYQLAAGADLSAAAPVATVSGSTGSVVLKPVGSGSAIIRTGTGRIDIAAANNVTLTGANAAIYSGGTLLDTSYLTNDTTVQRFNPDFAQAGGGVTLQAGHDIAFSVTPTQLINNWLWRDSAPTAWWVNAGTFTQGVGALGGGNLTVNAGHDVHSLTAVVPSNGHLIVDPNTGQVGNLVEHNQGSLDVQAGNSIKGGVFYDQAGSFNLRAGSIVNSGAIDPVFIAQGSNTARLQAHSALDIFGSFNPTWAPEIGLFENVPVKNTPLNAAFSTYADDSKLDLRSLFDDVAMSQTVGSNRLPFTSSSKSLQVVTTNVSLFSILPPNLDMVSFGGSVGVESSPKLMAPAATGQLRLLANNNINEGILGDSLGGGSLVMAALNPAALPSVSSPVAEFNWINSTDLRSYSDNSVPASTLVLNTTNWGLGRQANHGSTVLHADDTQPAYVVARNGDIANINIQVPKPLVVEAAGNIQDTQLWVQNLNAHSVTQVHAGHSLSMSGNAAAGITVTGPGAAEVLAGNAIDLGSSGAGITTRGNVVNNALPAGGANLIVAAGLGRGSNGFVQTPDYGNVLTQFVAYDAFASTGSDAASLNTQVLNALVLDGNKEQAAQASAALQAALQDRTTALQPGSTFRLWLSSLSAATRMRLALELSERVQAAVNQRFVATANTESFAPGYMSLNDLFPTLSSNVTALRQFVASNPFAGDDQADALRRAAVKGLPDALATVLLQALNNPAQASDPQSAFNLGLAQLAPAVLAAGSRQLMAQVQALAGSTLDALRAAGRVDAKVGTPFAKGLDDLARAFAPAGAKATNDITLVFSQIKAEQSGDIALLAPSGGVVAGLANPPAGSVTKQAYQLGVLTLGGGDVLSLVRDNFDVFQSRVFTVAGGDIHLWSSLGNIDAGRGPRDTVVAPPPQLVVDSNTGVVTLDISSSVNGSGIGALKTRDEQAPSNIRLIAPNGFIDAGEAGIRADTGTVTLGTNLVLNGGNINAGGGVTGGAVVVAPPPPLPQSSNAGQADKAVEQTQKALSDQQRDEDERKKAARRKRVTGEFIGFGDD